MEKEINFGESLNEILNNRNNKYLVVNGIFLVKKFNRAEFVSLN